MVLTDAMITSDIDAIFTDLAGTGSTETVSRIPAGDTVVERTFDVVRARQQTDEELAPTGFQSEYRFSFFAKRADIGATTEGDVIVMANSDRVRVLRIIEQPSRVLVRIDVGDEFEDGQGV